MFENSNLLGVGLLWERPRAERRVFRDCGEVSIPLRLTSGTGGGWVRKREEKVKKEERRGKEDERGGGRGRKGGRGEREGNEDKPVSLTSYEHLVVWLCSKKGRKN